MDLIDALNRIASRIPQQLPLLQTEEATKNALVMPLINALGYNVFDPLEVVPEFTADVGIKKGEKVDYAIMIDGKPMIVIECKVAGSTLDLKYASQLYRYFSVTDARFAILTDGIDYQFYSDLESPNKMDEKPFFEFSMNSVEQRVADELKKFSKSNFDLNNILSGASELKYRKQIKKLIAEQYDSPSEELVRLFTAKVISGRFTSEVKEQFTSLVKLAFREFVRDQINTRFKSALEGSDASTEIIDEEVLDDEDTPDNGIVTTESEIEAFHIVRAIMSRFTNPERVVMRDTKSYCGILLDDNNRKPICRLRFNSSNLYIGLFDSKTEEKISIDKPSDIYNYSDRLSAMVDLYDDKTTDVSESNETSDS